jgi:hypothetical protein
MGSDLMARAVLPRIAGALGLCAGVRNGFVRCLGADGAEALTRPESPSRCTFPITAFRVMPFCSALAIWLALNPSSQSLRSSSTLSSVQDIQVLLDLGLK